jgi:hypothetical protein
VRYHSNASSKFYLIIRHLGSFILLSPWEIINKTKSGNTSTIKIIHRVNLDILLYLVRDCIGSNQINRSGAEDRMDLARCVIAAVSSGQLVVEENERMVCG